jgi:peptide/nickel transport system permease protein
MTGIISIFIVVTIIFLVIRLIPGNPIAVIIGQLSLLGTRIGGQELVESYKRMFGLEGDTLTQYVAYLRETFRGNFGYSIMAFPSTVSELIIRALPWSAGLLLVSVILSWSVGTILGALAGWKEKSKLFGTMAIISLGLYSIPYWLLAILLVYIFAYLLGIFPISGGYTTGIFPSFTIEFIRDLIWHSILPALSIILSSLGWWYLSMRSLILVAKNEDYILFDKAKGLNSRQMMLHAFKNSLLPQVTGLALSLGNIVGGSLLTEVIFAYPGIGWLLYTAVVNLDYPLIQGITLIISISVCFAATVIDLIYPLIDPRIKVESAK